MFINIETEGGNCPVQIEGQVNGHAFYFRARGNRWAVWIAPDTTQDALAENSWYYEEFYGETEADSGWMSLDQAHAFLMQAFEKWG